MGKKPVLGLVGLCWLGLTVSGCKDCGCGNKSAQKSRDTYPVARRQAPQGSETTTAATERPRSVEEASVATKTVAPRATNPYDLPPDQYDPPGAGEVAAAKPAVAEKAVTQVAKPIPQPASFPIAADTAAGPKMDATDSVVPPGKTGVVPVGASPIDIAAPIHKEEGASAATPAKGITPAPLPEMQPTDPVGPKTDVPVTPLPGKTETSAPMPPSAPILSPSGMGAAPVIPAMPPLPTTSTQSLPPSAVMPVPGASPIVDVPAPTPALAGGVQEKNMPPIAPAAMSPTEPAPPVSPPPSK